MASNSAIHVALFPTAGIKGMWYYWLVLIFFFKSRFYFTFVMLGLLLSNSQPSVSSRKTLLAGNPHSEYEMYWLSLYATHPFLWDRVLGQRHTSVLSCHFQMPHMHLQIPYIKHLDAASNPLPLLGAFWLLFSPGCCQLSLNSNQTHLDRHFLVPPSLSCYVQLGLQRIRCEVACLCTLFVCQVFCLCLTGCWFSFLFPLDLLGLGTDHYREQTL